MLIARTLVSIGLIFSILILPWWISAVFLFVSLFYFSFYIEGVVIALVYDTIFSVPVDYFWNIEYVVTAGATLLLGFFYVLKKRLFWTQEW